MRQAAGGERDVPLALAAWGLAALVAVSACATGGARARAGAVHAAAGGPATIETLDRALSAALLQAALDPSAARLVGVGYRYYQLGIRDTAMAYFSRALDKAPRNAAAFDGRARIWRDWGLTTAALSDAHRAIYFAPGSAAAHNTLGTVLQRMHLTVEASAAYARAAALDRTALYAINNLCYLAFLDGRITAAIRRCQEAVQIDGSFVPARNSLALAYAAHGEFDQAWTHFAVASGEAVAHYNLGIVYLAGRQSGLAGREFARAAHVDPSFDAAHRRARQAEALARRAAAATTGASPGPSPRRATAPAAAGRAP